MDAARSGDVFSNQSVQPKSCSAKQFLESAENGNLDDIIGADTNTVILREFGDQYIDYVKKESERLLFELALIYPGRPDVWYAYIITPKDSSRNTPNHIGVTQSPYRQTALHSLNISVPKCKHPRTGFWRLRLFVGDFATREEAQNFVKIWASKHRMNYRLEKGPELARQHGKQFYYAQMSECPFIKK